MSARGHDALTAASTRLRTMAQQRGSGRAYHPTADLTNRAIALARVGAALAQCTPPDTFRLLVNQALSDGATPEDVLGVLLAAAPTVGTARLVANTPWLALALSYDIDAALEGVENGADRPAARRAEPRCHDGPCQPGLDD